MLPSFKGRVSKRDSGKASGCKGEEEEEMKAPAIGKRAFLFVFVRQAEGRDGSVLLLDPSQGAQRRYHSGGERHGKDAERPASRGARKRSGSSRASVQLEGGDARRQTRCLLEVGQIAVESVGWPGTSEVRTAGQVAQQLEGRPMRLSAMRGERCRVYKRIALS
ncbi:hypothetical protein M441DRAFT_290431 [Trichoderma asperellum CBS 433.97]|uniref:Uncharacterized protein n=1 Tax=Trichoderma asperellum (strain ATCC 204424 / CBS 433.97 / NBRC 101777) TaxID=1042311 RepID=A0A2T3YTV7_TRIA4|nr:hypothetical protein M441DRAFT_290431 [Trichoderma asperellum CBS 433.97]PTB36011.1 hypothetical protein M441DRAFT_290431 [Trichoderma asperellum CBS 433.97]